MNKKTFLIVAVAVALVALVVLWPGVPGERPTTNVEMLDTDSSVQIATSSVAYFPNANGYFVRPMDKKAYPGVVMIHENRGLRPETRQAAEMLAKEGYLVLAVDLFGGTAEDQTGARALTANFNQATGILNMRAAAQYLRDNGATRVASLGWCFGGRQSIELAISGEKLDATVVYYGGNMATSTTRLAPITWPVLGIFGDKDTAIPVAMVKTFEASLNTLGVPNEIYIYPGVGHAFANPSGMNYAPEATKDAWAKTVVFLKKYLVEPPTPAGVLKLETAKAGEQFGVWTVKENAIQPKEVRDFDGKTYTGLSGQILFTGALMVHGRYQISELHGGIIFYPDKEYYAYFPAMIGTTPGANKALSRGGELAIAIFGESANINLGEFKEATMTLTDLAYQEVFCLACDPWQGFYIQSKSVGERSGKTTPAPSN